MLPGMPYGYFMLLRVVVCVVMTLSATVLFKAAGREPWAWGCVALAVLFNPVVKIHLGRELWWWMDGVAAVWCVAVVNQMKGLKT